ncbi:MAG TPA: ABC transporter permease [Beijerinckiaceae bacterium]|nr:ABC transporter permease [Beijerinckiaceae bacterium]
MSDISLNRGAPMTLRGWLVGIVDLFPKSGLTISIPAAAIVFFGLVLPVGYLLLLSFNPAQLGVIELVPQVTFANYLKLVGDGYYWSILGRTLWVAAATTVIASALGFILAVSLWQTSPKWRGLLTVVVLAPLLVSIVARTFGWIIILGNKGLFNRALEAVGIAPMQIMYTDTAVIIGLVHVFIPYVVLTIMASLDRIDPLLAEAAKTLGASGATTVREIILPLAMPGVVAGATIVFSLAMSSYVTPAMMGAANSYVLATVVYQQFVMNFNWHFGAVLVAILLATSLLTILFMLTAVARLSRRWGDGA